MDKAKVALPTNLTVDKKTGTMDGHCAIVKYMGSFLR
jgi:hypothetical protein